MTQSLPLGFERSPQGKQLLAMVTAGDSMLSHFWTLEAGSRLQALRTSGGFYAKAYLSIIYFSWIL